MPAGLGSGFTLDTTHLLDRGGSGATQGGNGATQGCGHVGEGSRFLL